MFEDYKREVILYYKKRKSEGTLSPNLLRHTTASLKKECISVFASQYSDKDEYIFIEILGKRNSVEEYLRKLIGADTDIFRPLNNFLKGNTNRTHDRNIELLSWLIGFERRPFKFIHNNEAIVEGAEKNINEKEELIHIDNLTYTQSRSLNDIVETIPLGEDIKNARDVFISYSWDSLEHEEKIIDFTNHLRKKGFSAVIDKMLGQEETAINFVKMMYKAINDYSKVVVVLSKGYKEKADKFKGGVGAEYELLISDISSNPNKYILVSFEGRDIEVVPEGLKGRDIVDLSSVKEEIRLFEKLLDHKRYVFAKVAAEKPELPTRTIKEFSITEKQGIIIINEPVIFPTGKSSSYAGKYKSIDFTLMVSITNNTINTISGFACTLKIPREVDLKNYHHADADGFVYHELTNKDKLYPKQTWRSSTKFPINVTSQNIHQIIGAILFISVFTEQGPFEAEFLLSKLIKIKPANDHHAEMVSLSSELFV